MEDYRTVRGTATGEYEEKKSRFIAQLSFADSEEAAVAFLEQVRGEMTTGTDQKTEIKDQSSKIRERRPKTVQVAYVLEYSPPIGSPPSGSVLPGYF